VKTRGSNAGGAALLLSIVEALQDRLESDPALQTACATLKHFGLSPLVSVELLPSAEGPRVVASGGSAGVPQWTEKDVQLLRSVGIAGEPDTDEHPDLSQPRRRQPR
jgi:hypothetical protein